LVSIKIVGINMGSVTLTCTELSSDVLNSIEALLTLQFLAVIVAFGVAKLLAYFLDFYLSPYLYNLRIRKDGQEDVNK